MPRDRNGNSSVRSWRHRHIRNFVAIAHAGWRRHTKGMNSRSCGLVQRIGTANSAAPHPDPCGGRAPALHFSVDYEMPIDIPARVTDTAKLCRRPFSYQSLMPAGAGTPRV